MHIFLHTACESARPTFLPKSHGNEVVVKGYADGPSTLDSELRTSLFMLSIHNATLYEACNFDGVVPVELHTSFLVGRILQDVQQTWMFLAGSTCLPRFLLYILAQHGVVSRDAR